MTLYATHLCRSYSPTFCEQVHCTRSPVSAFTLHGVWPQYANGGWPEFCHHNSTEPPRTLPSMLCEWPSYMGTDAQFWEHEWTRHGEFMTLVYPVAHAWTEFRTGCITV